MQLFMELMRQLHVLMHVKGGLPLQLLSLYGLSPFVLTNNHIRQTNLIYNTPFVNLELTLVGRGDVPGFVCHISRVREKWSEEDGGGRCQKKDVLF